MTERSRRLWQAYEKSPPILKDLVASARGAWERQRRYGPYFRTHRLALEESQWWTPEHQGLATGERLRRFIHRAATSVPYYRDLFFRMSLSPDSFQDAESLRLLPLMDAETVRREYDWLQPEAEDAEPAILLRTPGPQKRAVAVPISRECFEREWAFRWQQRAWYGIRPGDRSATLADDPLVVTLGPSPPFWVTNYAEQELLLSFRRLSERTLPAYAARLGAWKPVLLHGPPSALLDLALGLRDLGDSTVSPRVVIAEGETLTWEQRAAIEMQFQCKVAYYYSRAEMVAHVAECDHGCLHIRPEHSGVELLNEHGEPAEPGEMGEIVGTGLGNISFPLIRYRTGDGATRAERPCPCNRGGLTLRSLVVGAFRSEADGTAEGDSEAAVAEAA